MWSCVKDMKRKHDTCQGSVKIIPWRIREENSTKIEEKLLWSKSSNTLSALEPKVQGTQIRARIAVETPKEWSRRGYAREESIGDGDERQRGEELTEHGCTGAVRARRGAGEARARRS